MTASSPPPTDTVIVGAGIAGLLCADTLRRAGREVVVLDKGRGPGGRMATRAEAGATFDHGAQFFTVRTELLQERVDEWLAAGWIREWFREAPWDSSPGGHPRYVGVEGMSTVARRLADQLPFQPSTRVERVTRREDGHWQVNAREYGGRDLAWTARHLVLTAPLPQSLHLLGKGGVRLPEESLPALLSVDYVRSLTALVTLDGPADLPAPGGVKPEGEPLSWIGDNQRKGLSPDRAALTLHSTSHFGDTHWEAPEEEQLAPLLEAARPWFGGHRVLSARIHRWRYNQPIRTAGRDFLWEEDLGLGMAGDAFGGPRVEGSAVSGMLLGRLLARRPRA